MTAPSAERAVQSNNWKHQAVDPDIKAVMLDSQASRLDSEDQQEILSFLPPYKGKDVMELGAGIGRFTGELAKSGRHVLAIDFIENLIKKNEHVNGHYLNINFKCADVTSPDLDIAPASADLVFSNLLLMYLSDEEVAKLTERIMKWLRPCGYIFFRESCFHSSGDYRRKYNPTYHRQPSDYTKVFKGTRIEEAGSSTYGLELVGLSCFGTYMFNKVNHGQVCSLWKKVLI